MRPLRFLVAAGALVLAACSPAPETPAPASGPDPSAGPEADEAVPSPPVGASISGTASWSGLDLPETARLIVEVRDVTRTIDFNDLVLKEEFPVTGGSPAAFAGTISEFDLIPDGNLVLRARVQDGYAILLASDGDIDIADTGDVSGIEVALFNPEDVARGGPAAMITPGGTDYVCAGEPVQIALEAGAAYVTFADGQAVKLDKLEPQPGAATQFSNGRFVVEQGEAGLRFGRGRAMPKACVVRE
jgi:hypothetical protein